MNFISNIQKTVLLAGMISASLFICNNPVRANQKTCITTDEGTTICGKSTSTKPPANSRPPVSGNQVEIDKVTFSLKGCSRDEGTVKCVFEIVNTSKKDKFVILYLSNSYIMDSSARLYPAQTANINGRTERVRGGLTMEPMMDTLISIDIENVPKEVTQARVLELNLSLTRRASFRNVRISN